MAYNKGVDYKLGTDVNCGNMIEIMPKFVFTVGGPIGRTIECENFFQKLNWLKSYLGLIFEFPAILLLFLETSTFQDAMSPKAIELF